MSDPLVCVAKRTPTSSVAVPPPGGQLLKTPWDGGLRGAGSQKQGDRPEVAKEQGLAAEEKASPERCTLLRSSCHYLLVRQLVQRFRNAHNLTGVAPPFSLSQHT